MRKGTRSIIPLLLLALLLAPNVAQAQEGDGYDLTWWTVDSGCGRASEAGSGYVLLGTVGQPEPAPALTGGEYMLIGGFWPATGQGGHRLFLPLILRQSP